MVRAAVFANLVNNQKGTWKMGRPRGSKNRPRGSKNRRSDDDMREASDPAQRVAGKKLVLSLIRRSNEAKTTMQSVAGSLGDEIKNAVEDQHLNAGALRLIARCARMGELKRQEFLTAFDLYRTYAEEAQLFGEEHVGDLVEDAATSGNGAEASLLGDVAGKNVERLRPIKQLSESCETARAPME